MKYAELAQAQAQVLIELMKEGKPFLPFLKPGEPGTVNNLPYNPTTGKAYRGGNRVMLWIASMTNHFGDNRWLTYKQALAVGAQVRKGAKSIPLRYVKYPERGEGAASEALDTGKPKTFFFNVFNADQVDGLPPPPQRPQSTPHQRIERCEDLLKASGAVIIHGSSGAHYAPQSDRIGLPYPERFTSPEQYYAVALHELAHWTGHASRLARDLSGSYGSESYAREEMVAETASHIMGVELGIGHDPSQHAEYIRHWMNIAREDPSFLYTAAASAEKVCDFVGLERFCFEPMAVDQDIERGMVDQFEQLPSLEATARSVGPEPALQI